MVKNSEMGYSMVKSSTKKVNEYKMVKYGKKQRNGVQYGEIEYKKGK